MVAENSNQTKSNKKTVKEASLQHRQNGYIIGYLHSHAQDVWQEYEISPSHLTHLVVFGRLLLKTLTMNTIYREHASIPTAYQISRNPPPLWIWFISCLSTEQSSKRGYVCHYNQSLLIQSWVCVGLFSI